MENNFMQVIEQTDEQQTEMYLKLRKWELALMLIEANKHLKTLSRVGAVVSAENGKDESFEIFDKLLDDCTKGKLFSGEHYWLTSEKRIYKIAKKYLSRVEMRKLEEKYASRFSH